MSIITISGSVGSGKTTIANVLAKKLDYELIHLNELTQKYKIEDVDSLQTFDFDLDKLLDEIEEKIVEYRQENKDLILEGHFAHFINPELVDILFVIGRDLEALKKEYVARGYNEQKIADNLEAESFNICFYEAIEEGYEEEKQAFLVVNGGEVEDVVRKMKILLC